MSITTRGIICVILMAAGATASAGPDIEVNYPVYDLGAVTFSENGNLRLGLVWIYNRGTTPLHIGEIGGSNPADYPFEVSGCAHVTLAPSMHCEFDIRMYMGVLGEHETEFDIASDDPDTPAFTVAVRGRVAHTFLDGRLDGIAGPAFMRCENLTTGAFVRTPLSDPSKWDCLQAGLPVSAGQDVRVLIVGSAERAWLPPDALSRSGADDATKTVAIKIGSREPGEGRQPQPNIIVTPPVANLGRLSTLDTGGISFQVENDNDITCTSPRSPRTTASRSPCLSGRTSFRTETAYRTRHVAALAARSKSA